MKFKSAIFSAIVASTLAAGAHAGAADLSTFSQYTYNGQSSISFYPTYTSLAGTASLAGTVSGLTSFKWFFSTNETLEYSSGDFNDYAYFKLGSGAETVLATAFSVGDKGSIGILTYALSSPYSGAITFGVKNVGDHSVNSTLHLSTLTTLAAVPEPETYAMLLAGLGVMGAVARRNKKTAGASAAA